MLGGANNYEKYMGPNRPMKNWRKIIYKNKCHQILSKMICIVCILIYFLNLVKLARFYKIKKDSTVFHVVLARLATKDSIFILIFFSQALCENREAEG